jgi:PAS domain S-box-containing protein
VRAPDISELETLVACAAEGSLAAAAERLGISRPAVAKRIGNLEALASRPLLDRNGRGVRLTDAGANLLAGSRSILRERDLLISLLREIREDTPPPIDGLRKLLGNTAESSRAAQQPEARLTETERILDLILRASTTGVVISDPETSLVHELNDAFCRFSGHSREEQLGAPMLEKRSWYEPGARERMLEELQERGIAENGLVRVRHLDGTSRVGQVTSRFITLAGARLVLSTVDDVTQQERLKVERTAGIGSYRAVAQVSKLLLDGKPVVESLASVIPEIRRTGGLTTVLLWNRERSRAHVVAGEQPPEDLDQMLSRGKPVPGGRVLRITGPHADAGALRGWAVPLASVDHSLILLTFEALPVTTQALYVEVLSDLATMAESAGG